MIRARMLVVFLLWIVVVGTHAIAQDLSIEQLRNLNKQAAQEAEETVAAARGKAVDDVMTAVQRDGVVTAVGADAGGPLLKKLFSVFHGTRIDFPQKGQYTLAFVGTNDVAAVNSILNGSASIGVFRGKIDDAAHEIIKGSAGDVASFDTRRDIGVYAVAILVNDRNPVRTLTLSQVEALYRKNEMKWAAVGGKDNEVMRTGTCYPALSWSIFNEQLLGGKQVAFADEVLPVPEGRRAWTYPELIAQRNARAARHPGGGPFARFVTDREVITAVAEDPHAIGYCYIEVGQRLPPRVRALGLQEDDKSAAVYPTEKEILMGK